MTTMCAVLERTVTRTNDRKVVRERKTTKTVQDIVILAGRKLTKM